MRTYRSLTFLLATCLLNVWLFGQVSRGGQPQGWGAHLDGVIPTIDLGNLTGVEEELQAGSLGSARYGVQRFLDADVLDAGTWSTGENGMLICRFKIRSPQAKMVSVQFDQFSLSEGSRVFLYTTEARKFIGSFTHENANQLGGLATAVLPGSSVVIQWEGTELDRVNSDLHVGSITHAFRSMFVEPMNDDAASDRGLVTLACHDDVVCPIGSGWEAEKRSVIKFLTPNGIECSGVLLNNTSANGTPYVHIANHCNPQVDYPNWVFYFNYESATCNAGDPGSDLQTVTGAQYRSGEYFGDFGLLELSSSPPLSYGACYAGWDRTSSIPTSGVIIGHPAGDVKKIATYVSPASLDPYPFFGIDAWHAPVATGGIEPGSSGSPMFDQNKRFVGQVIDGTNFDIVSSSWNCDYPFEAIAVPIQENWDNGNPVIQLKDWLDPTNTNATTVDTYCPSLVSLQVKVLLGGPYDAGTGLMNDALRSLPDMPLSQPYTALGFNVVGGGLEVTTPAVLAVSGPNAIVDWVLVELRDPNVGSIVIASVCGLLQRDGDVVSSANGVSALTIQVPPGDYHVAVRHRNHLGAMTAGPIPLNHVPSFVDLTEPTTLTYGTDARKAVGQKMVLWNGNVLTHAAGSSNLLKYTGQDNDRDPILLAVGGTVPTSVAFGYAQADVTMDGIIKYGGAGNDRDPILVNIGGGTPNNTRTEQLP